MTSDNATRAAAAGALERDGYPHEFSENGEDALEKLYKGEFDVVFADTVMNGMSGLDLAETIRKEQTNTEVVLVGANPTVDATAHALRLGVYDFLAKPLDNTQIISSLMRRVNDKVRLNRQNQLLLRDLQSNNTALVRLNQTVKTLYDDVVGLYIDTQRRNATLDMDTIYARGLAALREFLGARDVVLFRYDAVRQILTGDRAVQADTAQARAVSLIVPEKEFSAIQENVPLAALLDGVFTTRTPLIVPIFQGQTPWGAIAVLERESGAFTIFERNLLRQFVDWLALSFEGAHLYKAIFDLSTVDPCRSFFATSTISKFITTRRGTWRGTACCATLRAAFATRVAWVTC
ncbi:MAG: response regulator [Deltaproteobacteria bacterium]|nr:response regulator [Deltaproteobacteria bacterium]